MKWWWRQRLIEEENVWEDMLVRELFPKADFDHPVSLSADWPPASELEQEIRRIMVDPYYNKHERLYQCYCKHGYSIREAGKLAREAYSHVSVRRGNG